MTVGLVLREFFRRLAMAGAWSLFAFAIAWFMSGGRVFSNTATTLYTFLTLFSYSTAVLMALMVTGLARGRMTAFLSLPLAILAGVVSFFLVQSASVLVFDVIVGPMDGSVDIQQIDILHPDIYK